MALHSVWNVPWLTDADVERLSGSGDPFCYEEALSTMHEIHKRSTYVAAINFADDVSQTLLEHVIRGYQRDLTARVDADRKSGRYDVELSEAENKVFVVGSFILSLLFQLLPVAPCAKMKVKYYYWMATVLDFMAKYCEFVDVRATYRGWASMFRLDAGVAEKGLAACLAGRHSEALKHAKELAKPAPSSGAAPYLAKALGNWQANTTLFDGRTAELPGESIGLSLLIEVYVSTKEHFRQVWEAAAADLRFSPEAELQENCSAFVRYLDELMTTTTPWSWHMYSYLHMKVDCLRFMVDHSSDAVQSEVLACRLGEATTDALQFTGSRPTREAHVFRVPVKPQTLPDAVGRAPGRREFGGGAWTLRNVGNNELLLAATQCVTEPEGLLGRSADDDRYAFVLEPFESGRYYGIRRPSLEGIWLTLTSPWDDEKKDHYAVEYRQGNPTRQVTMRFEVQDWGDFVGLRSVWYDCWLYPLADDRTLWASWASDPASSLRMRWTMKAVSPPSSPGHARLSLSSLR